MLIFDLDDGRLLQRVELLRDGMPHTLGDMALLSDGSVLIADGLSGDLFRLRAGDARLRPVVARGTFISPQQPAPAADGRSAFVPDYVQGLASVDLVTGRVTWLEPSETVTLSGIDGLARQNGDLLACQSGVSPARVTRLRLDQRGTRVVGWTPIEVGTAQLAQPTHGIIVENTYYYIANSGWDRLEDDGSVRAGAVFEPAIIRRVRVGD